MCRGLLIVYGVVLLAIMGCGPPEPELAPRSAQRATAAAGCWELRPHQWQAPQLAQARVVRLDTAPADPDLYDDDRLLRVRMSPAESTVTKLTYWAPYARRDSLYVFLSDGFSGVALRLGLRSDSLVGTGYTVTDVVPAATRSGRVLGRRVPCNALAF
jgi:hypothetical protein